MQETQDASEEETVQLGTNLLNQENQYNGCCSAKLSFGMIYYIAKKDNGSKRTHPIIKFSQLQKEPNSGHAIQPILLSFFKVYRHELK